MHYTETEMYFLRQEMDQPRRLAFLLALCVHGLVAAMLMFMPSLFVTKPIVEEVVSVSLVAMPEIGGTPASAPPEAAGPAKPPVERAETPPPQPPARQEAPPEQLAPTPKEKVAVQPATTPEPVAPKNPISLEPDKRKIKKTDDTRLEEEKVKERELAQRKIEERELLKKIEERRQEAERKEAQRREEERQKALAQARQEQIKAENEAKAAAAEARALAAQAKAAAAAAAAVRADATSRTQAMQGAVTGSSTGRSQAQSIVEQTYWASVAQRVRNLWVLPEMRKWDANLLAMVVITINKSGEVTRIQFDQRSTDPHFDQLVEKTIRSAAPMPPFPALMQQETTVVGFKFKPGELGN